jgi:hypothetical protein
MSASSKARHSSSSEAGRENEKPIDDIHAKRDAELAQVAVVDADDAYLEHLGYKPEFKRDFTFLGLFSLVQSELAVLPGVAGTIWCVVRSLPTTGERTARAREGAETVYSDMI